MTGNKSDPTMTQNICIDKMAFIDLYTRIRWCLIKKITQTAVINFVFQSIFYTT